MNHRLAFAAIVVALAVLPTARAQRTLTAITSSNRQHVDAKLSHDGSHVAFRVSNQSLGVVGTVSRIETLLFTSATASLNHYCWDPNNVVLYFTDGSAVRSVTRSGGSSLNLGAVAGTNVAVWTTNGNGTVLYGSRTDTAGIGYVWSMPTSGGAVTDIVPGVGVIDEVRLDRTGRFLLFRLWSGQPFTPVQYISHDLTGPNGSVILYTSQAGDNAQSAYWLDSGQNFVFSTLSPTVPQLHLGRVGPSGQLQMLTDYQYFTRRCYVRPGSAWIVAETLAPDGQGIAVGVMPVSGGGLVLLDAGRPLWLNGGSLSGGLTMDGQDNKVALCAGTSPTDPTPQVYVASLDREIKVSPRLALGAVFRVDLPVAGSELGAVAVSFGLTLGPPTTVPGILGQFDLDVSPGAVATVVSGIGSGAGPLTGAWQIPNNPGLQGFRLFFQGVRLDVALGGSFTRWGHYVVH